jgi:predicted dienelactone hydrolase
LLLGLFLPGLAGRPSVGGYDPLSVANPRAVAVIDLVVSDARRKRDIPLLVYLPAARSAAAVALFSHGLGGSRFGCAYLGQHWAARGYVAVFLQHPGSDEDVWRAAPAGERRATLARAATPANSLLRTQDVPAVLDQLERWNAEKGHPLAGRLNLAQIGMSGHSFGAVTAQAVGGQTFAAGRAAFPDSRIKAVIAFSPSGPRDGRDPKRTFGDVAIPWMLMTGTQDLSPIGDIDLASRLSVFPALPPGGKYELVLDGARHSAFTDRPLPGDEGARNSNHHRAILALSAAFWDAWLRNDAAAKAWLDGDGPRSVLEKGDRWRRK